MNYHNILHDNMLNGDGLRAILFVSGCDHGCKGCHNPETHDINSGIPFDKSAKEEMFKALGKDYISGITFTGGEPLLPENRKEVLSLCKEIKEKYPTKTIWIYTGYTFEHLSATIIEQIKKYVDILVDGRYIEALRDIDLKWRGSANQRIINIKENYIEQV